jgi:hypothetical protein
LSTNDISKKQRAGPKVVVLEDVRSSPSTVVGPNFGLQILAYFWRG